MFAAGRAVGLEGSGFASPGLSISRCFHACLLHWNTIMDGAQPLRAWTAPFLPWGEANPNQQLECKEHQKHLKHLDTCQRDMRAHQGCFQSSGIGGSLAVAGWSAVDINSPRWEVLGAVVPQTFFSVALLAPGSHAATSQGCLWQCLHCPLCSAWAQRGGRSRAEPERTSPTDADSTSRRNVCVTTTQRPGWISLCESLWLNPSGKWTLGSFRNATHC